MQRRKQKKIAISMRGGMARALAYIGVFKALEEEGVEVDYLMGASMGGILTVAYGFGMPFEKIVEFARGFKLKSMFGLESIKDIALLGDNNVREKVREFIGEKDLSESKIKSWIQLTSINARKSVKLDKGNVSDLIAATIAFPFLVKPIEIDGTLYVDGDITGTWEVEFLKSNGADVVVGLETGQDPSSQSNGIASRVINPITIAAQNLRGIDFKYNPPDLHITDLGGDTKYYEFEKVDELVEIGYKTMKEKMPELKKLL